MVVMQKNVSGSTPISQRGTNDNDRQINLKTTMIKAWNLPGKHSLTINFTIYCADLEEWVKHS